MIEDAELAFRQYSLAVQTVFVDFQFIEESLKMYLGLSFRLIRKQIDKEMPFNFSRAHVENMPLGKLINFFKMYSSNHSLTSRRAKLTKVRNQIAHKSFILSLKEQKDSTFLDNEREKLELLRIDTKACLNDLIEEIKKLD